MKGASHLPLLVALVFVTLGGFFLLQRASEQARDTIRKHHLQDLEQAIYFARRLHGTYPPYAEPTWCGILSASENQEVRGQIEEVLRQQNTKYANTAKPFPSDPLRVGTDASPKSEPDARFQPDYFYWKHSPAAFELYAVLEQDPNHERNTFDCPTSSRLHYDYGLNSIERESLIHLTS